MKKIIVLLFSMCALTGVVSAQDKKDDDKDLPNGIRGGYQYSNLIKDGELAADNLNGVYLGYLRKFKMLHFFRLETGLEYMMAGAKVSDSTKIQLHYLSLPAQGVIKIAMFYGVAGLNANFKIAEKQTYMGKKVDLNSDNKSTFFDVSADAGVGFNILFVAIEARYYWGLLDVNHGYRNRYFQVGLKAHF